MSVAHVEARPRVLVVEDSLDEQALIRVALEANYDVTLTTTMKDALKEARQIHPQIIVVDVGLPDGDGYHLCSQIRNDGRLRHIPVVFLSGRDEPQDKVLAFSVGAQDYLEKPFDAAELRARLAARMPAAIPTAEASPGRREWGRLGIDFESLRAWVVEDSGELRSLDLTLREFRILQFLADHEGRVVTRPELLEHVWHGVAVAPRAVDTHVCNLRKKLGAARGTIGSIRGVGYLFQEEAVQGVRDEG